MKRLVETTEESGLIALLNEQVLLMCCNYFYTGVLVGVNDQNVELKNAKLVYETGTWDADCFSDAQALPGGTWNVQLSFIESYGKVNKQ